VAFSALLTYLLRGEFHPFESMPYDVRPAAFTNWNAVLKHPSDLSLVTFQTGNALGDFATAFPVVRLVYGHEDGPLRLHGDLVTPQLPIVSEPETER